MDATTDPQEVLDARNAIRSWGYSGPLEDRKQIADYLRRYMAARSPGCFSYAVAGAHLREMVSGPDAWRSR